VGSTSQCGEFSFTPFWGMLVRVELDRVAWYPNYNLIMSPSEQFKRNEEAGHFDKYNLVNGVDWREH